MKKYLFGLGAMLVGCGIDVCVDAWGSECGK